MSKKCSSKKGNVNQTPSEQVINSTGPCNSGPAPLGCGKPKPPAKTLCGICFDGPPNSGGCGGGGGGKGGGCGGRKGGGGKQSGGCGQQGGGCSTTRGGGGGGRGGGGGSGMRTGEDRKNETGRLVLEGMCKMWHDQKLCDVVLRAKGEDIRAHKVALAAHSDFLVDKFSHFPAGEVVTIDLCEYPAQIIHGVIAYIYSGDIDCCIETAGPILKCADELGLCSLVCLCLEYLGNITCETAVMCFSIAENYDIAELRDCSIKFICEHFQEVAMTKHFMYLPCERLTMILNDDNLNVPCELDVFCAVVAWVDFDRTERLCCAAKVLHCGVRLHCISPELLITKCESIDWLFEVPECEYVLNEAIRYQALSLSGSRLAPEYGEPHRPRSCNPKSCFAYQK